MKSFSFDFTKFSGFRWYPFCTVRFGITTVYGASRTKATISNSMSIITVHNSTTGRSSYSSSADKSHKHVVRRGAVFCLTTILLRIHLPRVCRAGSPLIHRRAECTQLQEQRGREGSQKGSTLLLDYINASTSSARDPADVINRVCSLRRNREINSDTSAAFSSSYQIHNNDLTRSCLCEQNWNYYNLILGKSKIVNVINLGGFLDTQL